MIEEENSYFKSVIRDAIEDLNKNGIAYVFSMEQVNAIKSQVKYNIDINYDGSFYILKNEETQSKRKKRKPNNIDKNEEVQYYIKGGRRKNGTR